jgi:hypothetical protein
MVNSPHYWSSPEKSARLGHLHCYLSILNIQSGSITTAHQRKMFGHSEIVTPTNHHL